MGDCGSKEIRRQKSIRLRAYVRSALRQPLPLAWHKLTHPLVWPVDLGPPERLMEQTAARYNHPREVEYAVALTEKGLTEAERRLIEAEMAGGGRVLVVGCGAGREAIALARMGYEVVGIDSARAMIEAARANAAKMRFKVEFLALAAQEVTPGLGQFDYILALNNFYSLIPTRALRVRTLRSLAGILKPAGKLFLGACVPEVYRPGPRVDLVDWLRRIRRLLPGKTLTVEPGDRLEMAASPIRASGVPVFVHVFLKPRSLELEIREAGWLSRRVSRDLWEIQKQERNSRPRPS